jgi:hypothetical protein
VKVDPAASLRCWAISVELGGRTFEVPALPAADWFPILQGNDLMPIVDMIRSTASGELDDLDELLLTGAVTAQDLGEALVEIIEETAGRSLYVSMVLVTVASAQWPLIGGQLARDGFRWDAQPLGAALDAIHSVIRNVDNKDFQAKLSKLLANDPSLKAKKVDRDEARAEFEAMAGPPPGVTKSRARSSAAPSEGAPTRTPLQRQRRHPADPSPLPTRRPSPPGRSAQATSGIRRTGAGPASGNVPPPPRP